MDWEAGGEKRGVGLFYLVFLSFHVLTGGETFKRG